MTVLLVQPVLSSVAKADMYELLPGQSKIVVRVYKGGALKALGHNHIISTRHVIGTINLQPAVPAESQFKIAIPVNSLQVDDQVLRENAGKDFSKAVDDDARRGTRGNMLGKKVLDVLNYPDVLIRSSSIVQIKSSEFDVAVDLQIHGVTRTVTIPVTIDRSLRKLVARGEFSILQSDYGITPLSAAFATIVVKDKVDISFELMGSKP